MESQPTYKLSIGPKLTGKIPPGSPYWQQFNGSFANREMEYRDIVSAIYQGHPFTTWHSNNWRTTANYLAGQHLGIDFDTEDERSTLPILSADPFINKYASIIYTTPSHTIEKPRARVVFLLDEPIRQSQNYAAAATSLLWIFGTADRSCKDAARFFYGAGQGADLELLPGVLPLAKVKEIICQYQKTGHQERQRQSYHGDTPDEQKIQAALKFIDPWGIEYDRWVSVLMSIHAAFPGNNGLSIAAAWGQGEPGEVERKWKSFKETGNTSGKVGVGTLFALAIENGYKVN